MKFFQFFENRVSELRSGVHLATRNSRTVFFVTESIINLGAKLWNMAPVNIKASESLNIFKSKTKHCTPNHCSCRICKTYIDKLVSKIKFLFLFESTICLTYLFFKDRILKILIKVNVKIFKLFVFIVPYNVLLYLPDNVLMYLAQA